MLVGMMWLVLAMSEKGGISIVSGLRVFSGNTTDNDSSFISMASPRITILSPPVNYPIFGELVLSLDRIPSGNLSGKILLHRLQNLQFAEDLCEELKDSGLLAYVVIFNSDSLYPGLTEFGKARSKKPNQPFPVFEITSAQNSSLKFTFENHDTPIYASFDSEDVNPWIKVYAEWIPPLAWIIIVISATIAIIATYKLTLHIIRDGIQINVPQLVLFFNIIANLLRFLHLIVDPFGGKHIFLYWWVQIGMTIPFPFILASALLITLYWHEMIQKIHKMNSFLNQSFIPFLIISALIFALELATSIARGLGAVISILIVADALVYAVIILALLLFFIVTKIRLNTVFRTINKSVAATRAHGEKTKRLGIDSNITVATGVFLTIYLIILICIGIGTIFWIPIGFYVMLVGLTVSMAGVSLLQVLLIKAPYRPWKWIICGLFMKSARDYRSSEHSSLSKSEKMTNQRG
jgi:hypothetical protein